MTLSVKSTEEDEAETLVSQTYYQFSDSVNTKSPSEVPPTHVEVKVPVGHVARAAFTQRSHLPLETLRAALLFTGVSMNLDVPLDPTVVIGEPWHFSIAPAIPPQTVHISYDTNIRRYGLLERMATFVSWVLRFLMLVSAKGQMCTDVLTLQDRRKSCPVHRAGREMARQKPSTPP